MAQLRERAATDASVKAYDSVNLIHNGNVLKDDSQPLSAVLSHDGALLAWLRKATVDAAISSHAACVH